MPSGQHHSNVQAQGTFADSQLPYCGGFVDLRSSAISWSSCGSRAWSSTGRSWYILIWDDMMHQTRWEVESRSISIYYFIYSNYDRLTLISDALFASMQLCINLVSMKGLYIAVPSSCSMKHEYLAMTCRGLRKCPARFGSRGAERGEVGPIDTFIQANHLILWLWFAWFFGVFKSWTSSCNYLAWDGFDKFGWNVTCESPSNSIV